MDKTVPLAVYIVQRDDGLWLKISNAYTGVDSLIPLTTEQVVWLERNTLPFEYKP